MASRHGGYGRRQCCAVQRWLRRLLGVQLLFALLCAVPRVIAADAVDLTAVVGFSDTFQLGRWTPLNVTVTNHGSDLSGELEVQVTGGDELRGRLFVTSHRRKLELHRESRKSLQFTVFPQELSHPLVIRVHSSGQELARTQVDMRTRFAAERLLLVLSRDADLDYLNEGGADGRRVLYPHPELLPVHWRGYDAVAAVVVHGVSLERLSTRQFEALHKWVAQGGILAVSGGPNYALLRSPRLAALLPSEPLGMTRIDGDTLQSAFSATLDVSRPVHVNRLGALRGRALLHAGAVPLIVERTLGYGRVVYLTFDVTSYPFDRWDGMRDMWLKTLRLPPPTTVSLGRPEAETESPLPALIQAESADFPSIAAVLFFLILYLGLLLAGYQLPVHGKRSRWLAPLWTWAAPVLFAPAAWLFFGPAVFPRGPTAVAMAVIEPLPGSIYARLALDLGVYANRSGALRLEYRGAEPVLSPPRQAQVAGEAGDWVFGEGARRFLEPLDRRRYVLHALQGEDVIVFQVEAAVHREAVGPRLVLDNASGRILENVWLVFAGYAYELGSIPGAGRIERTLSRRAHGVEVGESSWRHVLKLTPGISELMAAPTRIVLERRARAARESGYPSSGHALLLGYTANPLRPAGASAAWPRRERALVAFEVAALPGDAAASESATGVLARGDGILGRPDTPRVRDSAARAAAAE
jgi:hypothetical protein